MKIGCYANFHEWAKTPPMGWNSFDRFITSINEEQCLAQVDAQAKYLKNFGWDIFVLDHRWYTDDSRETPQKEGDPTYIDEYSRLVPSSKKFPSSADGNGLKFLADYAHSKGLRFGIHIMRGIPRHAVKTGTSIKGTNYKAADIANIESTCVWCPDMYGVDMEKCGAQEYYDSIIQLYADWGVDFIKVDDISRPYATPEIEAIRKAIDKTGRKIILSLSPGDTSLSEGEHANRFANMWRVSDDFWDRWASLQAMFIRMHNWTKFRRIGSWPDADMLPFGVIDGGRKTNFTKDEQRTCMGFWCITRSPLMLGADMTQMDDWTLSLLTNKEVLEINQNSVNNRQLYRKGDIVVWVADVPNSEDKYVGLFNAETAGIKDVDIFKAAYRSIQIGKAGERVAEISANIKGSKRLGLYLGDSGDGISFDHAAWLNPTLKGPAGVLKLTDLKWTKASAGWGEPQKNMTSDGKPIDGIGTHSVSLICWDLPKGYDTFTATGKLVDDCEEKGSVEFFVLTDKAFNSEVPEEIEISVDLNDLGFKGMVKVRDLWECKDIGNFQGTFSRILKSHASGLYRLSPVK